MTTSEFTDLLPVILAGFGVVLFMEEITWVIEFFFQRLKEIFQF